MVLVQVRLSTNGVPGTNADQTKRTYTECLFGWYKQLVTIIWFQNIEFENSDLNFRIQNCYFNLNFESIVKKG